MGKVRMADIADRVGVSIVTVHNALAGQKGVSDEMRERILRTAEELGYQHPSAVRSQMNEDQMRTVGVMIAERFTAGYLTFYWKLYQEMVLAASDKGCLTSVEILKQNVESELRMPRMLEENTIDGLIIIGEISRAYIRFLKERIRIPLIFVDFYDKELAEDAVIVNNFYGMYLMTEYLFDKGFRKLAFIGSIYQTSSIMDRYCGFCKSVMEHHVTIPGKWVIEDRNQQGEILFELPEELPEAFVCNCDLTASILIEKLESQGIRVPEDISVVGFDNFQHPGYPDRQLTTFEADTRGMAKLALEKVLRRLRKPEARRRLDMVSGIFVERKSVGAPGGLENGKTEAGKL